MTYRFPGEAAPFIATSNNILHAHGITVEIGSDFEEYKEIIARDRPLQQLGAPFSPDNHKFHGNNSFWLTGRNEEGELIHTQAAKVVDLEGRTLSSYLLRRFRDFPPPVPGVDSNKSRYRATPGAHRIKGQVVYHGEVWMAPERGRYRGVGLSTVLARTGLLEAVRRFDPDWVYGFMLRAVAFKGFSERMGYMHNEPGALLWSIDGRDNLVEAFLSYLSREDASYLLDMPVNELVSEAA